MRKRALLLCVACVLFAGCGEPLIEMNQTQTDVLTTYAAGTLLKFSPAGKHGIMYLSPSVYEEKEAIAEDKVEELAPSTPEEEASQSADTYRTDGVETVAASTKRAMSEVYNFGGASISYNGFEVKDSFVQGDYFSLTPSRGKKYLVLEFTFTNSQDRAIEMNVASDGVVFKATVNGKTVTAESTMFLDEDITGFQKELGPNDSCKGILLFEVSAEDVENVTSLDLIANVQDMSGVMNLI